MVDDLGGSKDLDLFRIYRDKMVRVNMEMARAEGQGVSSQIDREDYGKCDADTRLPGPDLIGCHI